MRKKTIHIKMIGAIALLLVTTSDAATLSRTGNAFCFIATESY